MIDNIRWKFVAAVAISAMAVSLLSGGLGGIRFGVLITRALIGGVVFTALAIGLNLLVARLFPEILEDTGTGNFDADTERDIPGSRVDITMPSEAPGVPGIPEDMDESPRSTGSGDLPSEDEDIGEVEALEDESEKSAESVGDLDRFSSDFSDIEEDDATTKRSSSDGPGGDHDPEELAQAIQTVIKRDEKG